VHGPVRTSRVRPMSTARRPREYSGLSRACVPPSVLCMKTRFGRFGRLGLWTADHRRAVALAWVAIIVGLGGLAPFAEHALSGAGWMAVGSQSDREAKLVDRYFPGRGSYALLAVVPADAGLRSV